MSGDGPNDINDRSIDRWSIERRRLLQAAGAGVGGLAVSDVGGGVAAVDDSETTCANGPFKASYSAGSVNVGRIRADQGGGTSPESMGAASPGDTGGGVSSETAAEAGGDVQQGTSTAGSLTIETEYDGVNSLETRGGVPSDSQVAVGGGKLLHVLNRDIAIYNKDSGKREQFFRLERLWEPVIPEPDGGFVFDVPFVFDPRARFDRNAGRFILCATQFQFGVTEDGEIIDREDLEEAAGFEEESGEESEEDPDPKAVSRPPRGWFLVAVSATSNPNGKWYVYRIPPEDVDDDGTVTPDNKGLVDYPTLGFDEDAIYLTQNYFQFAPNFAFDITMVTLDKAAMYAGEKVDAYHFDEMSDPNADGLTFTVQPAQQPFSGGSDGTFYLLNSDFPTPFPGPTGTLTLWELTNPLDHPSLSCSTLDVDPYVYPFPARQPESDSLIDTLGTRVMNADYDASTGTLWAAHSTAIPGEGGRPVAAIRWYEINPASGSVVQSGTFGTPRRSTFMPTVGADDGQAVIAHNVSGPETFPRMDVAGQSADAPSGELDADITVEEGQSGYNALPGPVERWGDYNGASVDPSSGTFWTVSQYSPDIDIPVEEDERDPYFTRIAEVDFRSNGGGSGR